MSQKSIGPAFLLLILILHTHAFSQKDQSGPVITLHSDSYQVGNQWFCPLCRRQVENRDRSHMDPKLCLSEWHDVLIDASYFRDKIRYISDEELAASLQRKGPAAAKNQDLSAALADYFSRRPDNNRLSLYDAQNKKYFITLEEFRKEVRADTARYDRILHSARDFYTPEKGFTIYDVPWGKKIDFNHNYARASKWGVHYLSCLDDYMNYFLLTEDAAAPKVFEEFFRQWYDQMDSVKNEQALNHTKTYDVIWYELGLSNRTQRLVDAHRLFGRHLSPDTNKKLLKIILGSTRWLYQCLDKTPFHPYNWQTHTAFTLSYVSLVYPEFREAASWQEKSRANMLLHLQRDIRDDGGYVERTPGYAEYMYSIFYRYMLMLKYFRNDESVLKTYLPRIEKFIEFFVLTHTPLGVNAPFNDAHRNKSLIQVFKEMAVFFRRGDFLGAVKQEFSGETLASLSLRPEEPKTRSVDFPDSQFSVMRDSWDPRSYFLIVNYGEFSNHCHYDQLDFEIYANGTPIALDAGIGTRGYIDPLQVVWYKHPTSHNMITINQAIPEKMDKPGYDKIWSAQNSMEYFAATHDGYVRFQKTRHRRHILFSKQRYWLIVDEVLTGEKDKEIDFHLHTPCSMVEMEHGYISRQDNGFLITYDAADAPNIRKIQSKGWADLGNLPQEPASREIDWLIFRKSSQGERRADCMATLIYPFVSKKDTQSAGIRVERVELPDKAVLAYEVHTGDSQDLILLSDGQYRTFTDTIAGDFQLGLFNRSQSGLGYAGMVQVGRFRLDGKTVSLPRKQDYEWTPSGNK